MAMLAAYGGLRCAEIAQVLPARDLVGDELTIHGKGGKVRAVPVLHAKLLGRLRLDALRGGWAFPNGRGGHLSPGHVSRLLSEALPGGWTGHTLRHRMGTAAYRGTRDLLAVSQLLGHARVDTTQRYVLLPDDALRAAVASAS
jgi:integrase